MLPLPLGEGRGEGIVENALILTFSANAPVLPYYRHSCRSPRGRGTVKCGSESDVYFV